jgi:hypothetical protein
MNNEINKEKRREYLLDFKERQTDGKTFLWLDETNYNLFCTRTQGRARKGERAKIINAAANKGQNVHIIGAISSDGYMYWESRRGSFKKPDAQDWVRRLLRDASNHFEITNIVLICDNAPCHSQ